jgi:hypothetical protein
MGAGNLWWALLQLIFVYVSADLWYTYIYIVTCIFIYTHKHHRYMHAYTCHPAKKHILCRVLVSNGWWSGFLYATVISDATCWGCIGNPPDWIMAPVPKVRGTAYGPSCFETVVASCSRTRARKLCHPRYVGSLLFMIHIYSYTILLYLHYTYYHKHP